MQVNNIDATRLEEKLKAARGNDAISQFVKTNQSAVFSENVIFGSNENGIFDAEKTTKEEIEQAAGNHSSEFVKEAMAALGKNATDADLTKLSEEGYDAKNTEAETIVTQTDKIKAYLAAHCKDYEVVGDISDAAIKEVTGSDTALAQTVKNMVQKNVAPNKENIEEIKEAMSMAAQITELSQGAMAYLISNNLPATIENIYMAEHSAGGVTSGTYGSGYYSTGSAYLQKTSADIDFMALQPQMKKVIENAGMQVNDETINEAKWLVTNHLPLTEETITKLDKLNDLTFPLDENKVAMDIIDAMSVGNSAKDAYIVQTASMAERANEACEIIEQATEKDVISVIEQGKMLNIANLKIEVQKENADKKQDSEISKENENIKYNENFTTKNNEATEEEFKLITARRKLEEIRLQMSAQANIQLLRQGIEIEIQPLEDLVEKLKNIEKNYYSRLFTSAGIEPTQENVGLYKEIASKVNEIKYVPNYVIGNIVKGDITNTINAVHEEGKSLQRKLVMAEEHYETLMTRPRADMGDDIKAAFRNTDDILKDIDLEINMANQRAVRILGYNSMEINQENIMNIKAADLEVNTMLEKMTPRNVLALIREGINPLDMDITKLNEILTKLADTSADSNEKYSEYLWKLEHNNAISKEERDTYIGMYRLLNSVEKSDGAIIGALVKQNVDITLSNLLMGVRTRNKSINVSVDDNFGGLERINKESAHIYKQLENAFETLQFIKNNENVSQSYYDGLVKSAMLEMSPQKLNDIMQEQNIMEMSLESFKEKLSDMTQEEEVKQYIREEAKAFNQAASVESNIIKILESYDQPATVNNILAANQMFTDRGSMFRRLIDKSKAYQAQTDNSKKAIENEKTFIQEIEGIVDNLEDETTFKNAYEKLNNTADSMAADLIENADAEFIDVKELMLLRNEISLSLKLSHEEKYQIPVNINDELTAISLTICHEMHTQGKAVITMSAADYGDIAFTFTLSNNEIKGYAMSNEEDKIMNMAGAVDRFKEKAEQMGMSVNLIRCMYSQTLDINKFESEAPLGGTKTATADLYKLSKAFIESL